MCQYQYIMNQMSTSFDANDFKNLKHLSNAMQQGRIFISPSNNNGMNGMNEMNQ